MQDEVRRWNAQTGANWVKQASKLLKRDFQGLRMVLEQDSDGDVLETVVCRNGPPRRRHGK